MKLWKIILRSLFFYRRNHLWVVLGTMMSTAILVGGLIIGDSVRTSMEKIVLDRLGNTRFALISESRLFRARWADELSGRLETPVAPLLQTKGIGIAQGGRIRAHNVQVVGVDNRFGEIGGAEPYFTDLSAREVIINEALARRLELRAGDDLLLRIEKLSAMPKDALLASDTESSVAKRYRIRSVASDSEFGRFNLKADQAAPYTVFVSLSSLSTLLEIEDRANVLLVSEKTDQPLDTHGVDGALQESWTLEDAGLYFVSPSADSESELRSNRIFLDPLIVRTSLEIDEAAQPILTYFVNEIKKGSRSTPYSFVSAPGSPVIPPDLADHEIIINDWLARDLRAGRGDSIQLSYFILDSVRSLKEMRSEFNVRSIVPMTGKALDQNVPDFPGLSDEENCRDWHPGIPIDLEKIRDKDETYWNRFRGTPKGFVTLGAARKMWQNTFGNATAIRFSGSPPEAFIQRLTLAVHPRQLGFILRDVKNEGLRASSQSVDFTQLFLGLSFFVIVAALLLTGLLFAFSLENRSRETGLYLALGFPRKLIRHLILLEGAVLACLGSLLGSIAGALYVQIILQALKTVWHGAVGTSALQISIHVPTVLAGLIMGVVLILLTLVWITRKHMKQPVSGLQKGIQKIEGIQKGKPGMSLLIGLVCLVISLVLLIMTLVFRMIDTVGSFFITGTLFLISGIAFANVLLYRWGSRTDRIRLSLFSLGVRNNSRRRLHSLTLIGLLASGLFIVFTVGANRKSAVRDSNRRESGTGGFALFGQSSLPVIADLNSKESQQDLGLDEMARAGVRFVQFRLKEGDDASCLNLNRVTHPHLIGVNPDELIRRKSFTFVKTTREVNPESPWSVLDHEHTDEVIPGIADQTVITWGLGKSVGDTLIYMDEKGETFKIKLVGGLANSIFQGNIIISEKAFLHRYPSIGGYRLFLVDAPGEKFSENSKQISWALQDLGLDLVPAALRLAEFNKVENTYLSIFLILGSFGLILGSIGIAIVVWRHVNQQRGELALLRALGFPQRSLRTLILSEHIGLLLAGIVMGVSSALLATLPSVLTPGSEIPYGTISLLLFVVLLNGALWTTMATIFSTRGDLLPALRNE